MGYREEQFLAMKQVSSIYEYKKFVLSSTARWNVEQNLPQPTYQRVKSSLQGQIALNVLSVSREAKDVVARIEEKKVIS